MKNKHKTWHDFNKFVTDKLKLPNINDISLVGYDIIEKIENYVKSHKDIKIVYVDDSVHASSILLLIPHPTMGITMLYVPQCTIHQNEFFLYENSCEQLITVLEEMKKTIYTKDRK